MADEGVYDMPGQRRMSLQGTSVPDAAVTGLPPAATITTSTANNTAAMWTKQAVVGVDNDGNYHYPLGSWTQQASPHPPHSASQQPSPNVYPGGTNMPPPTSTSASMYSSTTTIPTADVSADPHPVSPSAFFHVNYPADQCGIGSNDCVCGDSCACPGCTAHHGHSLSHSLGHGHSQGHGQGPGQGYGQDYGQDYGQGHDQSGARQLPDRSLAARPALCSSSVVEATAAAGPTNSLSSLPSSGGGNGGNAAGCCANKGAHFGVHTPVHHTLHQ
jgi:hypothetical protein